MKLEWLSNGGIDEQTSRQSLAEVSLSNGARASVRVAIELYQASSYVNSAFDTAQLVLLAALSLSLSSVASPQLGSDEQHGC